MVTAGLDGPGADFRNGPRGVLADQRFLIGESVLQGREVGGCAGVAEGHADIAQETSALGAQDG